MKQLYSLASRVAQPRRFSGCLRLLGLLVLLLAQAGHSIAHAPAWAEATPGSSTRPSGTSRTRAVAAVAATVTTTAATSIAPTSAVLGGNVIADGGATVTDRGVVYVVGTGTPTTANTKVPIGTGTGIFSQSVTGLAVSTQYTVRAYAINSAGTSYGSSSSFTTPAALGTSGSQNNLSCNGGGNGVATVNPRNGLAPYTYSWDTSPVKTTATVTGLPAGTYTVTVTDASSATTSRSFTLTQPSALALTKSSQTNIACFGGSTGAARANAATGGTPSYTYDWTPGNPTGDGTTSVTGLSAGSWTVTVTDNNGCTTAQTFTITQPPVLAATASQTDVTTNGGSNGTATITVSGGTSGYTYSWSPNVSTAATATGLSAGTYSVTATDANSCTIGRSFTITQPLVATAAPVATTPANGSQLATTTPTYAGTAPANSTVTLYVDGTAIGTTTATAGGSWSLSQPTALSQGSHTVKATAQTSGQSVSVNSNTNTFTVCAAPVALAQNVSLTLDVNGNATLAATAVNNGSTANCGPAAAGALSVSPSAFSCTDAVPATVASALVFGGTSQYITVAPGNSLPIGNSSYTLEAWIKPTSMGVYGIVGYGTYGTGPQVNAFRLSPNNGGELVNYWWGPDLIVPTGNLADGQWHHVAATYDGTTRTIYVDGVAKGSDVPGVAHAVPNASNATIGSTNNGEYFRGSLDEVRVWNVARTQAQLSAAKGIGLPGGSAGLVAYYRFNEGSGLTAADATGNAANLGTLVNGPTWTTSAAPVVNGLPVTLTVTDAGGNTATAPAVVTVTDTQAPVFTACGAGTPASPFTNLGCAKGVATGTYTFRIGGNTFLGYVDGTTDGGGWVEILNYVHQVGTNPALNLRTTSLPVQTSAALGTDENGTAAWGHAAPALVAAMNPLEVRFYAQTSNHARVIDFKTSLAGVLSYIKTGTGTMSGIGSSFTALPGHTANLPASANNYFTGQGSNAATEFPFYTNGNFHWGIKGLGNRWEVDDETDANNQNTIHRIFVRGSATAVAGAPVVANVAAGQCGAIATLTGTQAVSDNCAATVTYSPASGSFFAVGTTTVTATATDASGNTTSSSFPVTVTDNIAPALANLLPSAPVLALANVPEAAGYGVLYQVDMPGNASFGSLGAVPYTVNKSATVLPANPARVAYYVELTNGGTTKWVWASMDNFAANLTQLGLPHPTANPVNWHQSVSNLNVYSNNGGTLVTGSSLGTGRVEMWPSNYGPANDDGVSSANATYFDMGDGAQNTAAGHGSFQVHNLTTPQTVFGYNGWGSSAAQDGVGIGNQNAPGAGDTDWTFGNNVGIYTVKSLYILVPDASASIQSATVALSATGTASVSAAQVYRGNATDNCGTVTASVSPNTFTCANVGNNAVVVTLSDSYGNTTTQTTVVTVTVPVTPTTSWTGASSTDWTSCANWSYGKVPDAATSVIIPTTMPRYPSLPAGTYPVLSLTVNAGGTLTTVSGAMLQVNGNFTNNGTATLNGTVAFVGSAATQTLSNSSGFTTVEVNKPSGTVQLGQTLNINSGLTLTNGTLTTTSSYQVNLGGSASLSERETSYVSGKVVVNRTLVPGTAESFAGLGLTLTPAAGSAAPGATLVTRGTGTALSGVSGRQGIQRYFDIQPAVNTGLNVAMEFAYFDHELNGIAAANLLLFKSETTTAGPWTRQTPITLAPNRVSKAGISDFSIWTLGSSAAPLPVELAAFSATLVGNAAVQLKWSTASEKNSARFEAERSLDGLGFARVGTVAAQGTSSSPRVYDLLDAQLPAGAAQLYYRLKQVDADGTFSYSPVRVVGLQGAAEGLALYPNPAHAGTATLKGTLPGTVVTVFDALGRQVTTAPADATGTAALALPAGLPSGVYVVRAGSKALRLTVE